MGRLRHGEDYGFIKSISEEVVDLFGTDAVLYRHFSADQIPVRDPLWDEPTVGNTVQRKAFNIKMHFSGFDENPKTHEYGLSWEVDLKGYVNLQHLLDAGIEADPTGDYIAEGDVIALHRGTKELIYYDVINTQRVGWINTSHLFTGYDLSLKINSQYRPERMDDVAI